MLDGINILAAAIPSSYLEDAQSPDTAEPLQLSAVHQESGRNKKSPCKQRNQGGFSSSGVAPISVLASRGRVCFDEAFPTPEN